MSGDMLQAALAYAAAGRAVFPLRPKMKTPRTSDGFKSATTDEATIRAWFKDWPDSNLGMATGRASGVVVVDVDSPGAMEWFKANVSDDERPHLIQRTGGPGKFHALYRMPEGCEHGLSAGKFAEHIDTRGNGGYIVVAPSIHPSGATYQLMIRDGLGDGRKVPPTEPGLWDHLIDLPRLFWELPRPVTAAIPSEAPEGKVAEGQRNARCAAKVGVWFAKGYQMEDVADLALTWNLGHCSPPLPEAEVRAVVASICKGHGDRHPFELTDATAAAVVRGWTQRRSGVWRTQQLDRDLGIRTPEACALRDKAITVLVSERVIEQDGGRSDCYKTAERDMEQLDFSNLSDEMESDVAMPLDLNRHAVINPKNIIVIAGDTNSGKTAFMLHVAWLNRHLGNVRYLTSEMTAHDLHKRMMRFGTHDEWGASVKFFSRLRGFALAIDPTGINIVDYLEIHGAEFAKVADQFRDIFDALTTGVAFVALQKKRGSESGRGGDLTLEKARLALSLNATGSKPDSIVVRARVTKCKEFRKDNNIQDREYFYEVIEGTEMTGRRLVDQRIIKHDGWCWYKPQESKEIINKVGAHIIGGRTEQPARAGRYGEE